jgi:Zn-dependent M16 (insulinase) family peptidase
MHAGLSGLTAEEVEPARRLILDALEQAASEGVLLDARLAALRDLRVAQRGWPAGSMPAGLSRLIHAVPLLLQGVPLRTAFAPDEEMAQLSVQVADPDFFGQVLGDMLGRQERLCAYVEPDPDFFRKRDEAETAMLESSRRAMGENQFRALHSAESAPAKRPSTAAERDTLPCIRPAELSLEPRQLPALAPTQADVECVGAATNGMTQVRVAFDLTSLAQEHPAWLQLYAELLPELGARSMSYARAASWRRERVSGFGMLLDSLTGADGDLTVCMSFQASAPREDQHFIVPVLQAWISCPSFDDKDRLRYLIQSIINRRLNGLSAAGHTLAEFAACACLSAKSAFDDQRLGLGSISFLAELRKMAVSELGIDSLARSLRELHERITGQRPQALCIGLPEDVVILQPDLEALVQAVVAASAAQKPMAAGDAVAFANVTWPLCLTPASGELGAPRSWKRSEVPVARALNLPGLVQHCVQAWHAPLPGHPDAPILAVAAELLVQRWLHPALRERGGAYGAMAAYRPEQCAFVVSSFRDPRLAATYEDIDAAVWALGHEALPQIDVDEAIVGIMKTLDKPQAAVNEALLAWRNRTRSIGIADRALYRSRVLACNAPRLKEVALRWLATELPHRAAAVGRIDQDLAGLTLWNPPDLADAGAVKQPMAAANNTSAQFE